MGSGRMKKLFTRQQATLLAAIPKARVTMTAMVAAGVLSSVRAPKARSFQKPFMVGSTTSRATYSRFARQGLERSTVRTPNHSLRDRRSRHACGGGARL